MTNTKNLLNIINKKSLEKTDIKSLFLSILNSHLNEGSRSLTPQLLRVAKNDTLEVLTNKGYNDITIKTILNRGNFSLMINAPLGYNDHSVIEYV